MTSADNPFNSMARQQDTTTLSMLSRTLWNTTLGLVEANTTNNNNSNGTATLKEEGDDGTVAKFEFAVKIVIPAVFGMICLLGLIGNTLVILVVALDKNMRNTTNILILMLAVADLLFIVFCVPFTAASYAMPIWPFGNVWCKVVQYLTYVCAYASVYTLVLMSLDRYLAVVHAIRSMRFRNERNTWIAVSVTWSVIAVCHIPLLLEYDLYDYTFKAENRSICVNLLHISDQKHWVIIFYSCFLSFGFVLPLGAVCLMYGLMLKRLHGAAPGGASKSQESMRAKRRVTKMVVIIVAIFALCWLPLQICFMLEKLVGLFTEPTVATLSFLFFSNCLAYMNSCVNPFLYAFLSENFRRSFKKILFCQSPVSRRSEYELVSVKQSEGVTQATAT